MKVPYEIKLNILMEIDDLDSLKNLCKTSKDFEIVCKENIEKIVTNMYFKRIKKTDLLDNPKELDIGNFEKIIENLEKLGVSNEKLLALSIAKQNKKNINERFKKVDSNFNRNVLTVINNKYK